MKPLPIQPEVPRPRPANTVRDVSKATTAYQVLLILSTLLAGVFCALYLTKPVVQIASTDAPPASENDSARQESDSGPAPALLPGSDNLPGDDPDSNDPATLATAAEPSGPVNTWEETNLKIQHVLSATSPDGEIGRIVTDVPVLYESRTLRWKPVQVAEARALLGQLQAHRQKTTSLRAEGMMLLSQWQNLLARSIPATILRADSPTLPINQSSESGRHGPAGLETSESIEVKTADNR